jgi:hypothetical protein
MTKEISIDKKDGGRYILIPTKDIETELFEKAADTINEWVRGENPVLVLPASWEVVKVEIDKRVRGVISIILFHREDNRPIIYSLPFTCYPNEFNSKMDEMQDRLIKSVDMDFYNIIPGTLAVQTVDNA